MADSNQETAWLAYRKEELSRAEPRLRKLGFSLDDAQPHTEGERFLMQAVTTESGKKLILLGTREKNGKRVVIKATSDHAGIKEIEEERRVRAALKKIGFAYQVFHSPEEIHYEKKKGLALFIQEYLPNDPPFLERATPEQFALALKAFKAQEGAHATTYRHRRFVKKTFKEKRARDYLASFAEFRYAIEDLMLEEDGLSDILKRANHLLSTDREAIERYEDFLTHTDFVPHNFRVRDGNIYLLDHSSIRFGNKHEGWARFMNFMTLYNPELEKALMRYVHDNRSPEEEHSLKLMRIYRLGEIIYYYAGTLKKTTGDLRMLNLSRIRFWHQVLESVMRGEGVPESERLAYIKKRDSLRSPAEKRRQENLH